MTITGLSKEEVAERKAKGEINSVEQVVSRSYKDIIVKNLFTRFNTILIGLGLILLVIGLLKNSGINSFVNAFSACGIVLLNVTIATIQEIRAKRRLDKIALLLRPKVTVIRDGIENEIDQSEIVKDDVVVLNPGDQALVDGDLLEVEYLEMDESLLTGESHTVRKKANEKIYSGSYCVTGKGYYKVDAFGDESFAAKMLKSAKKYTTKMTPLQMETSAITGILVTVSIILLAIVVILTIFKEFGNPSMILDTILVEAIIVLDIVPVGLFLLIVITYMIAAIRMADSGVLLQRSSAVESISHVDTVCMDKTGTITTNKLLFKENVDFIDETAAADYMKRYLGCTGSVNHTIEALIKQYGRTECSAIDEIRFSSDRKFSAVLTEIDGRKVGLYIGAYNVLGEHIDVETKELIDRYSSQGLRTVVFGYSFEESLYRNEMPVIPDLKTISVIAIVDEVRSDCRDTIDVFLNNEMDIKVISGDDPATVDALFTIANIPGERKIISGEELDALEGEERTRTILETNIFGRMKPDHKEMIIETLKNNGRYVAMVGDGINDVKSLKMANVGVALESGSGAARGVADMVLVNDNFNALPKALVEGKKTVSGMRDILKLYLSRNFVLVFIIAFIMIGIGSLMSEGAVPFLPTQNTVYAFMTVSVTAFLMAIWSKPSDNKGAILPKVLKFAIPAGLSIAAFGLVVYVSFFFAALNGIIDIPLSSEQLAILGWPQFEWDGVDKMLEYYGVSDVSEIPERRYAEIIARNAMMMFLMYAGIMQQFMVVPICKFFSVDGRLHEDPKPTVLFVCLLIAITLIYVLVAVFPEIQLIYPTLVPQPINILMIAVMVVIWFFLARAILRSSLMDSLSDKTEKWYRRKLRKMYSTSNNGESTLCIASPDVDLRDYRSADPTGSIYFISLNEKGKVCVEKYDRDGNKIKTTVMSQKNFIRLREGITLVQDGKSIRYGEYVTVPVEGKNGYYMKRFRFRKSYEKEE